LEYEISSTDSSITENDFRSSYSLSATRANGGSYPGIGPDKIEYRGPNQTWTTMTATLISVGRPSQLNSFQAIEFRARAGAVIGDYAAMRPRDRRSLEILTFVHRGSTADSDIKSHHLIFTGGEGCGQWAQEHGHIHDENGVRIR